MSTLLSLDLVHELVVGYTAQSVMCRIQHVGNSSGKNKQTKRKVSLVQDQINGEQIAEAGIQCFFNCNSQFRYSFPKIMQFCHSKKNSVS